MERIEEFNPTPIYDAALAASPVSPWPPVPLPAPAARKTAKQRDKVRSGGEPA